MLDRFAVRRTALALFVTAAAVTPVMAAPQDGRWSVLVVTEKGTCDKAFRYEVAIADGKVTYAGQEKVNFSGSVAANGAVKVDIRLGDQGASGAGRLGGASGAGTWQGVGSSGQCAGRWEAERR